MKGICFFLVLLFTFVHWSNEADEKAEGKGSATVKTGDDNNEADIKLTATGTGDSVSSNSKMEATADEKSGQTKGEANAKVNKKKKEKKKKSLKKNKKKLVKIG